VSASLPADDDVLEALFAELEGSVARGEPVDAAALAARRGVPLRLVEDCLASLRALTGRATAGEGELDRLGPYELLEVLGRGGMGAVYRARHPQLDREVAVKVLRAGADATAHERARFLREAEALGALRHPNVVTIHDAGQSAAGGYLVLELVAGARSITAAAADLDWRGRVALARDAARGLGYAHARGVIHRDVKPENLLVDPEGRVRVSDFGLARLARSEGLTESGTMIGTLAYMAPEQARGDVARQGPTADVWGLGAVLHELLTGRALFPQTSPQALLDAQLAGGLPSLRDADPSLPRDLEAVLRRALALDPGARYPHGDALADDLDAVLAGRRPPGVVAGARRRATLAAAVVVAASLALAAAALAWSRAPAGPAVPAPPDALVEADAPTPVEEDDTPWSAGAPGATPGDELLAARRWLGENPTHRRAGRARSLVKNGRRAPLCELEHTRASAPVAVAFDGSDALVTAGDGWLRRWSLPGGAPVHAWRVGQLQACLRLPDGDWIFAGHAAAERWPGRALRIGDDTGQPGGRLGDARRVEQGAAWVTPLPGASSGPAAVSPDGRLIAFGAGAAGVVVLDAADGARRVLGDAREGTPRRLLFSADERLVVARERPGADYTLELWDVGRGELLVAAPVVAVSALARLPGDVLALGSHRGTVTLHDAATLALQRHLGDPALSSEPWVFPGDEAVGQLEPLPARGAVLALPGRDVPVADRALKWLDVARGRGASGPVTPPLAAPCHAMAVSPDGCLVAIGRRDGRAEVWLLPLEPP
jgi:serine/threonine-protein kinase